MSGLPIGMRVRLGRRTRVLDGGRTLVGGSPTRALFLTADAARRFDGRELAVRDAASSALADRLLDAGIADPVLETLPECALPHSYVVPVRDRPTELARLLASIHDGAPVIVVDDASRDPDAVRRVAIAHGATVLVLDRNLGPAGARNAGLARVTTPVVVFVDSDIVLEPDTALLLKRHFADPRVAMAVPRIAGLDSRAGSFARYEDTRSSLDLGPYPATVRPRSPVAWASTACVVARRAALGAGFAPGMRVAEDVDLVWRLVAAGWRVRHEPAAHARHEHRIRFTDWFARRAFYGTGAALLAERHAGDAAPAVLAPWSVAAVLALLAQRRWSLPVVVLLTGVTAVRIARRLRSARHPMALGARLAGMGLVAAIGQAMALLLRHWWPAAALAALGSTRIRRAIAVAAVVDVALEYRRDTARLDPVRFAVLRRIDDLAYGAGVWAGALRARSPRALLPAIRSVRVRRGG